MISILGYACFYPSLSTLEVFGKILQALLKEGTSLSGYVLSASEKVDIRKKSIKKSELNHFFVERFAKSFNEIEIRGQFDLEAGVECNGKVHVQFSPSPLDSVWSKFSRDDIPRDAAGPVRNSLLSLHSSQNYVFLRHLEQYPNIVSIAVECDEKNPVGPNQLHATAVAIADALQGVERWVAVLDAEAYIPRLPTSKSLTANPDTVDKMDRFFLIPHLSVGGRREIIQSYIDDLKLLSPKPELIKTNAANTSVITAKNWNDREHLFLPKWHEHLYPNPSAAPSAVRKPK